MLDNCKHKKEGYYVKNFLWRHKTLLVIWVAVLGIGGYVGSVLFSTSSSGDKNPYTSQGAQVAGTSDETPTEAPSNQPKKAKVGESAKDGNLEFTVNEQKCNGEKTIGENQYAQAEAEGQFCRVNISIKNTGSSPVDLPLSAQRGLSPREESYSPDEAGTQYAQADQTKNYWYQQIAAGATVSGDLVFSMNGNEELVRVELHGEKNTPGVKVDL